MKRILQSLAWSFLPVFSCIAIVEKPMVIVIPSYNNAPWCLKNIQSAVEQNYTNFRIIYIDDCSTDGTGEKILTYIEQNHLEDKVTFIHNTVHKGALENLYNAIHFCQDCEIILTLDGDDWFMHNYVLKRINQEYQDSDVWLTYGQFLFYPKGHKGFCAPFPANVIQNNSFRSHPWLSSHLRTFYAGLFKRIKKEDLMLDGKFFEVSWDQAMLLPMLEMAGFHAHFISDILYVYNYNNPINDEKKAPQLVLQTVEIIRRRAPYHRLEALITQGPDLIVFSFDRPLQLYALLESIKKNIKDINSYQVIYRASSSDFEQAYEVVKSHFSHINFKRQQNPPHDFKPLLLDSITSQSSAYIIFAVDDIVVKEPISLIECIRKMEEYKAYGFYLRIGLNLKYCYATREHTLQPQAVPPHRIVENKYCLWNFNQGVSDWNYPHSVDMTLYRKSDVIAPLRSLNYSAPNSLEGSWAGQAQQILSRIGICYTTTGIVNIPLNIVNQEWANHHMHWKDTNELLRIFNQGMKINIEPIQHMQNLSPQAHYEPAFITR